METPSWLVEAHALYQAGKTMSDIATQIGQVKHRIAYGFKKYNLSTKKVSKLISNDEIANVAAKYEAGITPEEISLEYNVSVWSVRNILKTFGVKTLSKQERKTILGTGNNFEYFKHLDKEGPAYFYGLLLSDGNLYKDIVQIGLQSDDRYILETLKEELGLLDNKVKDYDMLVKKTGNVSKVSSLRFMDRRIVESLRALGFAERKSGKEVLPEELKDNRHFWRGIVDGDGFVSTACNKLSTGIIGSKEICEGFLDFCKTHASNVTAKVRKHKSSDIYVAVVSSGNARSVLDVLYEDSEFFLTRKKYKALNK